jgi:hypothetical protein
MEQQKRVSYKWSKDTAKAKKYSLYRVSILEKKRESHQCDQMHKGDVLLPRQQYQMEKHGGDVLCEYIYRSHSNARSGESNRNRSPRSGSKRGTATQRRS